MIKRIRKKNIGIIISAIILSFMLVNDCSIQSYACETSIAEKDASAEGGIEARSIIQWRYKVIDGVLYRRKYNYTEEHWIGDWEVVPLE